MIERFNGLDVLLDFSKSSEFLEKKSILSCKRARVTEKRIEYYIRLVRTWKHIVCATPLHPFHPLMCVDCTCILIEQLQELPKTRAIVVALSLCVAKTFKHRRRLQQLEV